MHRDGFGFHGVRIQSRSRYSHIKGSSGAERSSIRFKGGRCYHCSICLMELLTDS